MTWTATWPVAVIIVHVDATSIASDIAPFFLQCCSVLLIHLSYSSHLLRVLPTSECFVLLSLSKTTSSTRVT
uniref:Putative 8.9 kDa protein n=1 Tax=Ixodes ricinus TaxID=34613 RepID=A0A0K8R723_IXORI